MQQRQSSAQYLVDQVVGTASPKRQSYHTNPSKQEQMPSLLLIAYVEARDVIFAFLIILLVCTGLYEAVKALVALGA